MKKRFIFLLVLGLATVFNYFFWQEALALNLFLFTSLTLLILLGLNRFKVNEIQGLNLTLTLLSGVGLVVHGSSLALTIHLLSFITTIGVIRYPSFLNNFFSALSVLFSFKGIFSVFTPSNANETPTIFNYRRLGYIFRIGIIPLAILFIFFMLYQIANPVFLDYVERAYAKIDALLVLIFEKVSLARVFFFLFGLLISAGILFYSNKNWVVKYYTSLSTVLQRKRKRFTGKFTELKTELLIATVLLVMINALLLVVNIIDINWIWLDFNMPENFELKQFVHEGTYVLIASIMLAILLMFYYFRANLNFIKNNQLLKTLSYIWIMQNVILAISVFMRNYHYISYHGLANKRLGVIVFLIITISGLISLLIKIHKKKTAYYSFNLTTWVLVFVLSGMSLVNWDRVMCNYNLSFGENGNIEAAFYLDHCPTVYPILYANLPTIHGQILSHASFQTQWQEFINPDVFDQHLLFRTEHYLTYRESLSWLSWSVADEHAIEFCSRLMEERRLPTDGLAGR